MAIDNVEISTAIGVDGNSYTAAISNDKLTNEDFLTLMLEEMKMQDPTKPMDSAALMDSQLQMSTIESNLAMTEAMAALQTSYANSALSTAAGLIGNIVEDGSMDDNGLQKSFKVETVESVNGEMYVNAKQLTGLLDNLVSVDGDNVTALNYDTNGYIYEDGAITDVRIQLTSDGRFDLDVNNNITLLDDNNEVITDNTITDKYKYNGTSVEYADDMTTIAMSTISKVR